MDHDDGDGRPTRPDLGIDPEDVVVKGREVHVTVHSLGSVPTGATELVVRDKAGRVVVGGKIPALAAPVDLLPKTTAVTMKLPKGISLHDCTVEIDPAHQCEEITTLNNVVKL